GSPVPGVHATGHLIRRELASISQRKRSMKPTAIMKWSLAPAALALAATVMLSPMQPSEDLEMPLIEQVGDNEIPHLIMDGIVEIGGVVIGFLKRMLIG